MQAKEKCVHLLTDSTQELKCRCDETRLKQIVFNLVGNAINHTNPGGSITISAAKHGDKQVCFSVKDTGTGINEEQLKNIFEPFYKVDRDGHGHGHGLGLTIVKDLVEVHGGKVWVTSVVDIGTQIHFTMEAQ